MSLHSHTAGPATLRANFSVKVVESDGNIPVDLSLEPVAFPTPGVFQWSKDGMSVNLNSEINYTYPTAIFQRLISRSDSGDYSLTATNHRLDNTTVEVGTGRGNFILDVLCKWLQNKLMVHDMGIAHTMILLYMSADHVTCVIVIIGCFC